MKKTRIQPFLSGWLFDPSGNSYCSSRRLFHPASLIKRQLWGCVSTIGGNALNWPGSAGRPNDPPAS